MLPLPIGFLHIETVICSSFYYFYWGVGVSGVVWMLGKEVMRSERERES